MSTVNETLTAAQCGMPLLGLTVITNMAAGILDKPLSDEEVNEVASTISTKFTAYVKKIVEAI
jgi:purine-nucleoside phosphorylase